MNAADLVHEFERQVRALGAVFNPEVNAATRSLYQSHLDLSPAGEERTDVAYGAHARHRLDVYLPAGQPRSVVVYVHGGGFVAGDKNGDGVFYVNLGRWLARNGHAAVLHNYRLAPSDPWPAGARDLQSVVRWVDAHRERLGATATTPVVVWGQSAGASHVASWFFDDAARGEPAAPADAVLLMSGFYLPEAPLPPGPRAYFGEDAALYPQRAPLSHVKATRVPVMLAIAELDPGWLAHHTYALARALTLANGQSPQFHYFRGHNHVSTVQSLGSAQVDAGDVVLRFLAAQTRQ